MAPVRQAGQTGWVGGLPASVPSTACAIRKTPQDPEGPAGGLRCQKAGLCQELAGSALFTLCCRPLFFYHVHPAVSKETAT